MNKLVSTLPMVAAAALLSATPAVADVAYMTGLFGAKVDFASIVAPPGQGCDPGAGCTQIPYANFNPGGVSVTRGAKAIEDYVKAHPGQNTIWTYSDSTDAVVEYVNTHPEDTTTQFYLLGAPSTPGNVNVFNRHPTLMDGNHANVTYVLRQYDIVADVPAGTRYFARANIRQAIHRRGYDNLDLTNPAVNYVDPRTGSTTKYFLTYPLPVIYKGNKTPEQIAAEDQVKRPLIESQYYLPGKVQRPVVLPAPTYPVTTAAAVKETAVTTRLDTTATASTADTADRPRLLRKLFSGSSERRQSTEQATTSAQKVADTAPAARAAKKDRPRLHDRIAQRRAERAAS
ncbi:MAG: hypothetical protein AB1925_12070 [Actinomycetota bacterium]